MRLRHWRCWFKHSWAPPRGKCVRCGKWPKHWRLEMGDKIADLLAKNMTECYASEQGCKRFPVRMIAELDADNVVNMVMLCPDHAATYKTEGKVLFDKCLTGENLKFASKAHW